MKGRDITVPIMVVGGNERKLENKKLAKPTRTDHAPTLKILDDDDDYS